MNGHHGNLVIKKLAWKGVRWENLRPISPLIGAGLPTLLTFVYDFYRRARWHRHCPDPVMAESGVRRPHARQCDADATMFHIPFRTFLHREVVHYKFARAIYPYCVYPFVSIDQSVDVVYSD